MFSFIRKIKFRSHYLSVTPRTIANYGGLIHSKHRKIWGNSRSMAPFRTSSKTNSRINPFGYTGSWYPVFYFRWHTVSLMIYLKFLYNFKVILCRIRPVLKKKIFFDFSWLLQVSAVMHSTDILEENYWYIFTRKGSRSNTYHNNFNKK